MKLSNILNFSITAGLLLTFVGCNNEKSVESPSKSASSKPSIPATPATSDSNASASTLPRRPPDSNITLEPASEVTEATVKTPHFLDTIPKKTAPSITIAATTVSKEKAEFCRMIEGGVYSGQSIAITLQKQKDEALRPFDIQISTLHNQGLAKREREVIAQRAEIAEAFTKKINEVNSNTAFVADGRANCK